MHKFNNHKLLLFLLIPFFVLAIAFVLTTKLSSYALLPLIIVPSLLTGGLIVHGYLINKIDRLTQLTNTDTITGLYNEDVIGKLLNYDIERAKRYQRDLSIVLLDIDNFSLINDTYGKKKANEVLHFLSQIILQGIEYIDTEKKEFHGIRTSDIAFRYKDEDKILLIMPETSAKGAYIASERLREAVMFTPFADDQEADFLQVTLSAGVVSFDSKVDTAETLLQRANLLLLKAKITKNHVVIENPIHHGLIVFANANTQ